MSAAERMTLGEALARSVRVIAWCKGCGHQVQPDIGNLVSWHGAGMLVIDWAARLQCQLCGARDADVIVTGARQ